MDFLRQKPLLKVISAILVCLLLSIAFQTLNPSLRAEAGLVESAMSFGKDLYGKLPKDLFKPLHINEGPEIYGPTRINAQLGNQGLSVALNRDGTITVFRYPRPSFYDQVKHHATDRHQEPFWGADPNAGAFLGLVVQTPAGKEVHWLRNWESNQRYVDDFSDVVRTTYTNNDLGLTVTVKDLVPINESVTAGRKGDEGTTGFHGLDGDALIRNITVRRTDHSPVKNAKIVGFENFNLVVSKNPLIPTSDWAQEIQNTDYARYVRNQDAIVHTKSGHDLSKNFKPTSVATVMGFEGSSSSHEVSGDRYLGSPLPDGAYDGLNKTKTLSGRDRFKGQTTGALSKKLQFSSGEAQARLIFTAADSKESALDVLQRARSLAFGYAKKQKEAWFETLTEDASIPRTQNRAIVNVSKRALSTLLLNYDPRSGGIVASIATQSPYGLDWPRDGAYFNYVLDHELDLHEWVEKHNYWYAERQEASGSSLLRPEGTFAMNYYTDGPVGGPIPWEIDEGGYAVWLYYDHYRATGDREYLKKIWPAMKEAAEFLRTYEASCGFWVRDCANLQKLAFEDDNVVPSQTIIGAGTAWMAMDAASKAARTLGKQNIAAKFRDRKKELGIAINRELWDHERKIWGKKLLQQSSAGWLDPLMAELTWPIRFRSPSNPRMEQHIESSWDIIKGSFEQPEAGKEDARMTNAVGDPMGLYETKTLLSGAMVWKNTDKMARVERGLKWSAERWATNSTNIMGEVWMVEDGEVITTVSQPHAWEQILFYLAAVEAYPDHRFYFW